jgi:hypothetical protein
VVAGPAFGQSSDFLEDLESAGQPYVVEIPGDTPVRTTAADPAGFFPAATAAATLAGSGWRCLRADAAAGVPSDPHYAVLPVRRAGRVPSHPSDWLLVYRAPPPDPGIKYYLSNAPADTPPEVLARIPLWVNRADEWLAEARGSLGMAHYETRSWTGWHHHMSLVALAHLLVTLARQRLKKTGRGGPANGQCRPRTVSVAG